MAERKVCRQIIWEVARGDDNGGTSHWSRLILRRGGHKVNVAYNSCREIKVCCGNKRIRRYSYLGNVLSLQKSYSVLHVHQMQFPDKSKVLRCLKYSRANWSKYIQIIAGSPCVTATQARQETQSLQVSDSSNHPLFTLHQNLPSVDWPHKPSPHSQGHTLPTPGWLDGPRRIDERTPQLVRFRDGRWY